MTRNHLILLLVAFIFIASNALVNVGSSRRYNGLLQDYQQVNGLLAINNRRQTYFKLYSKSHDEGTLKQYYDECQLFDSQLRGLDEKMKNDRKCKMMYRIVGQVAEYRREMAESYIRPDRDYYPSLMADLDEVDLEIERCLNQLMSQYLEYLNTAFASHSRTLGIGRRDREKLEKEFAMWGVGPGWFKVVLISSPALVSMGGFSQEVLKNYFHMAGVTVLNSIWMDQMIICLYSPQQDAFTELTGCITRARDYLAEERKIPVACGVSGAYEGMERLTEAYGEAASFIREYSAEEARLAFDGMTDGMKRICGLEDRIIQSLSREDQDQSSVLLTEMIEELETLLGYQDVSVKLNFGRSLMTIIRGINQIPGIRVKTSEAAMRFEKLGQLNFNGDNLKYHVEYFSEMKIQKE